MGRHSRKGRGDARDTAGIRTAHGGPHGSPQAGAPEEPYPEQYDGAYGEPHGDPYGRFDGASHERRGTPGHGIPGSRIPGRGTGIPGAGATPPGGVPQAHTARGGHPEQRESGGAWGAAYGTPYDTGSGYGAGFAASGPAAPPGPAGPVVGARSAGVQRGPRQDYVDAFDDVFAAGAPDRGGPATYPGVPAPAGPPEGEGPPLSAAGTGEPPEDDEPFSRRQQGGGKGRTLTGVTAAAVTTVLAVVIAGHVSGQESGGGSVITGAGSDEGQSTGDAASGRTERKSDPLSYDDKMAKSFPLGTDAKGSGDFRTMGGHEKGPGGGQVLRYRVDVEKGLPLEGGLFTQAVHKTLNDKRSWAHGGERSFERVSSGDADFVITLASPGTTDVWCAKSGLDTSEEHVSCDSAATDRVMINGYRWAQGAKTYGPEKMHVYRQMLINHEVGHRLGHDHVGCEKEGALAPVMMQQTKYLSTDGRTCKPNAWPHPRG